jgi:hypothetical protein
MLKKNSEHQINQSEQKISQENCVSYIKSVKEPKIRMGATRRNLQAQPKILKKIIGTPNLPIKTKINEIFGLFFGILGKSCQIWPPRQHLNNFDF